MGVCDGLLFWFEVGVGVGLVGVGFGDVGCWVGCAVGVGVGDR